MTGKMVAALKKLGFNKVFDTNTGADFTIMEEATELVEKIESNNDFTMFTSCCPAWVRFIELNYPNHIDKLSTCKSPQSMFGSLIKSYYAKKENIDPKKIFVVSVMPCVAKKYEVKREELKNKENISDVDLVITTRELARMIKKAGINFNKIEDETFDDPMGIATGAGAIFGTTGGVMEAALRTASDLLTKKYLKKIEYSNVRGLEGIKTATISINNKEINLAVVSGLANAKILMDEIENGISKYNFIEVMSCPGGCIMGGGQPIKSSKIQEEVPIAKLRANALYSIDEKTKIRKSHKNPVLINIYDEYLGIPGGKKAKEVLHVKYNKNK